MLADRPVLRFLLTGVVALMLVIGGVAIGASLWPRMVTVEQHVIAPAVRAVSREPGIESIPDLVDATCPAVVAIVPEGGTAVVTTPASHHARKTDKAKPVDSPPSKLAGFLVSGSGYVLTSTTFLPGDGGLTVLLSDGRRLPAARAGSDPVSGLALLKVEGTDLPVLQFATDNFPRTGQPAVTLWSPNGSGCTVQLGLVSADFVTEQDAARSYVRVSPALRSALAGAPVLDEDGRVMGVAGLGLAKLDRNAEGGDASLLVPAAMAAQTVSDLLRNGQATTNPLGLYADDLTPTLAARLGATRQRGAVVTAVVAHSPADRAGFRAGDIVLAVGTAPVAGASELARALDGAEDQVAVQVLRHADEMTLRMQKPAEVPTG